MLTAAVVASLLGYYFIRPVVSSDPILGVALFVLLIAVWFGSWVLQVWHKYWSLSPERRPVYVRHNSIAILYLVIFVGLVYLVYLTT